jgi:hypothetical protein
MQTGPEAQYERRRAFLKLLPGGPASQESIVYYFDRVLYSFERQTMQLVDPGQDLTVSLAVHGEHMVGTVRSSLGRTTGKIEFQFLSPDDEAAAPSHEEHGGHEGQGEHEGHAGHGAGMPLGGEFPKSAPNVPWLASLNGDWTGNCGKTKQLLQVRTGVGGGALGWSLGATLGRFEKACSLDQAADLCWQATFATGAWNPFQATGQNLRWAGPRQPMACRLTAESATCDRAGERCEFVRPAAAEPKAKFYRREHHLPMQHAALPDVPEAEDLRGEFWGLLHHEGTDRYQLVELNVESFYDTENPHKGVETLNVSAEATVYFGAHRGGDRIVARFQPRPFANTFPDFAFDGPGDTQLRVTSWHKGMLHGVWYSKSFGRVGTIELVRGDWPAVVPSLAYVPGISGAYVGKRWNLTLRTVPSVAMHAWDALDIQGASSNLITGPVIGPTVRHGYYDWFTGRLALETEGVLITGKPVADGLDLHWPIEAGAAGLLPLQPAATERFLNKDTQ